MRAREIRDEILLKRREAAFAPARREDPFEAEVAAARERLAEIDAQIEEKRRRSEGLAAPRERLAARSDELQATTARLQEQNRARVAAIYRSAKLGAGAAGWHPEPVRSARLSRYLAAIAATQNKKLEVVEVEHGSAIAALDLARAEDATAAAELRLLDADRAEAAARLERAVADAGHGSATEVGGDDPSSSPGMKSALDSAQAQELAIEQAGLAMEAATRKTGSESAMPSEEAGVAAEPAAGGAGNTPTDDLGESAREIERAAAELAARQPPAPVAANEKGLDPEVVDEEFEWPAGVKPADTKGTAAAGDEASADVAPDESGAAETAPPPRRVGLLSRLFGNDRESDSFAASRGKLPAPVAGKVVANYGQQHKSGATYRGVILRAGHDAPVKAVAGGQVSFAGELPGLGNTVIVSHGGRYHTVYARLGSVRVKEGQGVSFGTELGELPSNNADMHFELRDQGKAVDPLPWLKSGVPGAAP